jgi:hypothetical protein
MHKWLIHLMFLKLPTDIRLWKRDRNYENHDQRRVLGHIKKVNTSDLVLLSLDYNFTRDRNKT